MAIGVTDGTRFYGMNGENAGAQGCLGGCTGLYGSAVGTKKSGTISTAEIGIGLTTDGTKSGLITKFSGLTLGTVPSKKLGNFYIRY